MIVPFWQCEQSVSHAVISMASPGARGERGGALVPRVQEHLGANDGATRLMGRVLGEHQQALDLEAGRVEGGDQGRALVERRDRFLA